MVSRNGLVYLASGCYPPPLHPPPSPSRPSFLLMSSASITTHVVLMIVITVCDFHVTILPWTI